MTANQIGALVGVVALALILVFHHEYVKHEAAPVSPAAPISATVEKPAPAPIPPPVVIVKPAPAPVAAPEPVVIPKLVVKHPKKKLGYHKLGTATPEQCARVKAAAQFMTASQIAAAAKSYGATPAQVRAALVCLN